MPEGLRLVVSAEVREAMSAVKRFVNSAGSFFAEFGSSVASIFRKVSNTEKKFADDTDRATGSLVELKQIAKGLKLELAAMDSQMLKSKGGKVLAAELKIVNAEIRALERQANISGQAAGNALTKGFSGIRTLANILPGIGIGGLFAVAFSGIEKFIGGLTSVKRAFNAAAVEAELFKKAAEAKGDDITRLNALVAVARDVSFSTNQRKNAISELQKLYPDYLRNLSLETINSANASKAIDDLTQSIINKALVQEFSTRAAAEIIKKEELHQKVLNREAQTLSNINQLQKLIREGAPSNAIKKFTGIVEEANAKLRQETVEFNKQSEVVKHFEDRLKSLTATSLDFIKTPKAKKFKAEFIPQFQFHDRGQLQTNLQKIFDNIKGLVIPELHVRKTDGEKLFDELNKQVSSVASIKPIPIPVELTLNAQQLDQQMKELNAIMERGFADLFSGIGETIATKDITNINKVLGSVIQQIGKALIQYGVIKTGLDKILKAGIKIPGVVAIGLGIAAVAIGQLIKNAKPEGFKEGGFTGFGSPNEIAGVVHKGEFVIPAKVVRQLRGNTKTPSLGGLLSNGPQVIILNSEIAGSKIKLVQARADRSQKRLSA